MPCAPDIEFRKTPKKTKRALDFSKALLRNGRDSNPRPPA